MAKQKLITNDASKVNTIVSVFTLVLVVVAMANLAITFYKVSDFNEKITGNAVGYVNLTVSTSIAINISQAYTAWGNGVVNATGQGPLCTLNATLTTHGLGTATSFCGNWSGASGSLANVDAIVLQNVGSANCSIHMSSDKDADSLVGGTASINQFRWNITNKDAGACVTWNTTWGNQNQFVDVNTTQQGICERLSFASGQREMMIDTQIVVPYDSLTGDRGAIFTITADVAA